MVGTKLSELWERAVTKQAKSIYTGILAEKLPRISSTESSQAWCNQFEECVRALCAVYDIPPGGNCYWASLAIKLMFAHVPAFMPDRRGRPKTKPSEAAARQELLRQREAISTENDSEACRSLIARWRKTPASNPFGPGFIVKLYTLTKELRLARREFHTLEILENLQTYIDSISKDKNSPKIM